MMDGGHLLGRMRRVVAGSSQLYKHNDIHLYKCKQPVTQAQSLEI